MSRTYSHILGDICCVGEAYHIYSGIMFIPKIISKIDCIVYMGNAKRECII